MFAPPRPLTDARTARAVGRWRSCVWPILLWLLAFGACAQTYGFRDYAQADGLQGLSVSCLYEDREGVVWAGTELGLHRFERERFEFVGADAGIGDGFIRAIAEDAGGRLWVATSNGLYLRERGHFFPVLRDGKPVPIDRGNTLVGYRAGVVAISQGGLLAVTPGDDGRWRFAPLRLRLPDGSSPPVGEALLADGPWLWTGCGDYVCRVDRDGDANQLGPADGVPAGRWQAIFRDRAGTLWLRGGARVLSRSANSPYFVEHDSPAGSRMVTRAYTNMVEDARGRLLTRADDGLVRWDGDHWQTFNRTPGMAITPLPGPLLVTRSGALWIGTRGLGVQRWLGYDAIEHWDETQGLAPAPAWSILRAPDGELLVGSDSGSSRFDPVTRRMRPWTLADGAPLPQGTSIALAPDGAVWLGRSSGRLARRDPRDHLTRDVATLPYGVRGMAIDAAGWLWAVTAHGIYQLAPGAGNAEPVPGLPDTFYEGVAVDRFGRLWAAGSGALFLRSDGRWRRIKVRGNLPSQEYSQVAVAPDGEVWLSLVGAGLWRGRLGADDVLSLAAVDDPLVSRVMPYVLEYDSRGWLWVGSSQGLDLYRDGRWSRATQAEGLLWDDISSGAFFEDRDGSVWIGSSRGVSRIYAPQALFAATPLQLRITRVRRELQPVLPGQSLLWSDAPLEIDLSTPGAAGGAGRIAFRYRVQGYQPLWSPLEQSHLSYPLLASGRYVLEVQALDSQQRLQSEIARFPLEIFPPWWRSPLALLLYTVGGLGLVLLLLRWRTRRLVQRERELERLVAERTGELEREKRELESARATLALKATHDELTGLLNRAGILDVLRAEMAATRAGGQPLAVVLIDLDHFKLINDQYGHLTGDGVLSRVGRRLNASLRDSDRVGRYGGEELLAILPGLGRQARNRVRALHDAICMTPFALGEQVLEVTCSIGVAWYRDGESLEQLLARADAALYRAKHGGRARIELEDEADVAP